MVMTKQCVKRLNLLSDTELYEDAVKFVAENEFRIPKTQMNKIKGLVQTLSGTRACDSEQRMGIIINYLKHQADKNTTREDEKIFYNNLIQVINSNEGLRRFLNIDEFSDCIVQEDDGRKIKGEKRKKQDSYIYYIAKEFLGHVIAEKMKGIYYAN